MSQLTRIRSVKVVKGFQVRLNFTDGTSKDIDLRPYLIGPVFEPIIKDRAVFMSVTVDPRTGTIGWPGGVDLDPDVLYHGLAPQPVGGEVQVSP
jgi:hypothetical protein